MRRNCTIDSTSAAALVNTICEGRRSPRASVCAPNVAHLSCASQVIERTALHRLAGDAQRPWFGRLKHRGPRRVTEKKRREWDRVVGPVVGSHWWQRHGSKSSAIGDSVCGSLSAAPWSPFRSSCAGRRFPWPSLHRVHRRLCWFFCLFPLPRVFFGFDKDRSNPRY